MSLSPALGIAGLAVDGRRHAVEHSAQPHAGHHFLNVFDLFYPVKERGVGKNFLILEALIFPPELK